MDDGRYGMRGPRAPQPVDQDKGVVNATAITPPLHVVATPVPDTS